MANLFQLLNRIQANEKGQAMVEYGLILALVAIVAIVGLTTMGGGIDGLFGVIRTLADKMAEKVGG